jgi:hypothetical protein
MQYLERVFIAGNRPESFAVGCVGRGFMPPHGRVATVHFKDPMRESVGKEIQVGEIEIAQFGLHLPIVTRIGPYSIGQKWPK